MVYGLPYKGSKNAIAERIVSALPSGTNFCDCCCGGGAISQAAALSGKFKTVTGYDINKAIIALLDATMVKGGVIDYEHKVLPVTKSEFYESRDRNETLDDFLNRYIASFGFNGMEYLWGDNRVALKTLQHRAISAPTLDERRESIRDLLNRICKSNLSDSDLRNLCNVEQATNLMRFKNVEDCMQSSKIKTKLQFICSSMFDIPFEKYDVLYFDPPYSGTKGYNGLPFSQLMFKTLLQVLIAQGKTVFVSEYQAPDTGFVEILAVKKMMTQDSKRNITVQEKLFYGGLVPYEELPGITKSQSDTGSDSTVHVYTDIGIEQVVSDDSEIETGSEDSAGGLYSQGPEGVGYPDHL